MIPRVDVLGVGVSAIDQNTALAEIESWIVRRDNHYICVTGVHGVMESQRDRELLSIHNASGLTTPDGMPLVWCARFAGAKGVNRVYGPDLMVSVARKSVEKGWSHYFYGGAPGIPDTLAENLKARFPGLKVVGSHSPPFRDLSEVEVEETVNEINKAAPDIVWVGLSTPKQERWMARFRPLLDAPVLAGVGAAFDIHAGTLSQAPSWMQRSGMEWAYRLVKEPRRLWRRYLRNNPAFLARIVIKPPKLTDAIPR